MTQSAVVKSKFLSLNGTPQISLQQELCTMVHSCVKHRIACLTKCLGTIHRNVSITQNVPGLVITSRTKGDSNARAGKHLILVQVER